MKAIGSSLPRHHRHPSHQPAAAVRSPARMHDDDLLAVLRDAAAAVPTRPRRPGRLGPGRHPGGPVPQRPGRRRGRLAVLDDAGLGGLSEESGVEHAGPRRHRRGRPARRLDQRQPGHPLVRHQPVRGRRRRPACRAGGQPGQRPPLRGGRGAGEPTVDGRPLAPSGATDLGRSIVGLSGLPRQYLGWKQYRALGAAALDLCAVADGILDGYLDCSPSAHGSVGLPRRPAGLPGGGRRRWSTRSTGSCSSPCARPRRPPHAGRRRHARADRRPGRGPPPVALA